MHRFEEKGAEGLKELSWETKNNRNTMPEKVKNELLRLKRRSMKWGHIRFWYMNYSKGKD
jgi:hypothetical protein